MQPRKFALIAGIVLLALGVLSLIIPGSVENLPALHVQNSYGWFLGLFPLNIVNKVAFIVLGLIGIAAANSKFRSLPASIHFSRAIFFITAVMTVLGLFPQTNTLFGYMPLFSYHVIVSAAFAVLGAYYGWTLSAKVPDQSPRGNSDFRSPVHNT